MDASFDDEPKPVLPDQATWEFTLATAGWEREETPRANLATYAVNTGFWRNPVQPDACRYTTAQAIEQHVFQSARKLPCRN